MSLRDRFATRSWYKWYVVGVLTAVYASSQVDRQIMGMLLEPIKLELGASDTQMGFLIGLTFAVFYATSECRSRCSLTGAIVATSLPRPSRSGA